jgi:4a-hydroxytetrahydrobiopterin dehydratase
MAPTRLDGDAVAAALATLGDGWTGGTSELRRSIVFSDFPTAIRFVDAAAEIAESMNHHPTVLIRWRTVDLLLSTHTEHGVTELDVELARRLDGAADALPRAGVEATPVPPGLFG